MFLDFTDFENFFHCSMFSMDFWVQLTSQKPEIVAKFTGLFSQNLICLIFRLKTPISPQNQPIPPPNILSLLPLLVHQTRPGPATSPPAGEARCCHRCSLPEYPPQPWWLLVLLSLKQGTFYFRPNCYVEGNLKIR